MTKSSDQPNTIASNPLLSQTELPNFSLFKPEHIEPGIRSLIDHNRKAIHELLEKTADISFTFENLAYPLEELEDNLREAWGLVEHISKVAETPEWRKAHDATLPIITEYFIEMSQHQVLFQAFLSLKTSKTFDKLNDAQKKVIENRIRDFKLSGATLEPSDREKFGNLQKKLTELKNKFQHNVVDATDSWCLHIQDEANLKGLPEHTKTQAKDFAKEKNKEGWCITLDFPCYYAVMCYAEDPELREKVYKGYATLASDSEQSENSKKWDNGPLIVEILNTRKFLAQILGFKDYAESSLFTKMLKNPEMVLEFLNEILEPVSKRAKLDMEELRTFVQQEYNITDIKVWDVRYFSERLLEKHYRFSEDALRKYFPESAVLEGLFTVVKKLFNLTIKPSQFCDGWHDSVKLFEILDEQNVLQGRFYLDLYTKAHKKPGAWCGDCKTRIRRPDGSLRLPLAYIVANFTPPHHEKEAQLSHDEVITLFHEFGHCLHFILSQVEYPTISPGRGVPWDAIELPSQLMENWCWEKEALDFISKNQDTHESLPDSLIKHLRNTKNFQIGLSMARQLEFALFDFKLHMNTQIKDYQDIQNILDKVREKTALIPIPEFSRTPNTFLHIFAGPYAAGYYSYLWSEVLAADVYHRFKEHDKIFDTIVAKEYVENILKPGGSEDFMALLKRFLGRPPKVAALLKSWGLYNS